MFTLMSIFNITGDVQARSPIYTAHVKGIR